MSDWNSKETVLQFIEMYRTLPALWMVKSKDYTNKLIRELAYSKMIKFCRKFNPSADKQFVVNKINNLRSAFRKELKKVETSKLSGAGGDEVYESKLWYFHHLMFIEDQEDPSTGMSNLDTCIENACLSSSSLFPSNSLKMESEVPMSTSASSEISVGLDGPEKIKNEDFAPHETLSQSSLISDVSSQSTSYSHMSPLLLSPGPIPSQVPLPVTLHPQGPSPDSSHYQGPSPDPWHSQGVSVVDSSLCPSHASYYGAAQGFSGRHASTTPPMRNPYKRKSEEEEILHGARAKLLNPTPPPPPLDENEAFGKLIALHLRNVSKEQRIYARKLTYEVIAEAELDNLSQASFFVASPDSRGARRGENDSN